MQSERPFQFKVGCSTCRAEAGVPCAAECPRRPYADPIVEAPAHCAECGRYAQVAVDGNGFCLPCAGLV